MFTKFKALETLILEDNVSYGKMIYFWIFSYILTLSVILRHKPFK